MIRLPLRRLIGSRVRRVAALSLAMGVSVATAPVCSASPSLGAQFIGAQFIGASGVTLLAKSWLIGYALVALGILLGLLAVLIPSMRKALRRKDG